MSHNGSDSKAPPSALRGTPKFKQSMGEFLVGVDFNPSQRNEVALFKKAIADAMDFVASMNGDPRCMSVCLNRLEEAAMWGVKSMTKPKRK